MKPEITQDWFEANKRYVMAMVARVRENLARHIRSASGGSQEPGREETLERAIEKEIEETRAALETGSALDRLCEAFSLSPFERDALLLCAGMELEGDFGDLCAAAQSPDAGYPTFRLALKAMPGAHWTAITPAGPLRKWRLIEITGGPTVVDNRLRIDERVLSYLLGLFYVDERLQPVLEYVESPSALPVSYYELVARAVRGISSGDEPPVIVLIGDAAESKRCLATAIAGSVGLRLSSLRAADLPESVAERDAFIRLWQREAVLTESALLIEVDRMDDPVGTRCAADLCQRIEGLLFVCGAELPGAFRRRILRVRVDRPQPAEQRALWEHSLGPAVAAGLNGQLDALAAQFRMDAQEIIRLGSAVRSASPDDAQSTMELLWESCRIDSRAGLQKLAERIETLARWEDIVLPEEQLTTLREIAVHVRQRSKVYDSWGFAKRGVRGLGITALFVGPSGTGKTLASDILGGSLHLDLYRIDLSRVVSKYIGETEKNLRSVFDAAEHSGAVLLFDEADALFGKRSEVRDSHDRYANIEVSYLLQRMEAYHGLALLTTNRRSALDPAFLRRIRFVVSFPFPDASQRARIWERVFPPETPTEGLDPARLAKLNVAGGNIRNIAINAAFLAAEIGEPVRMDHLLQAARGECAKLERQISASELGGWV